MPGPQGPNGRPHLVFKRCVERGGVGGGGHWCNGSDVKSCHVFKGKCFWTNIFGQKLTFVGYSRGCLKQFSMVPNGFAAKMGAGKGGLYFVLDFHSNVGHSDVQ